MIPGKSRYDQFFHGILGSKTPPGGPPTSVQTWSNIRLEIVPVLITQIFWINWIIFRKRNRSFDFLKSIATVAMAIFKLHV